MMKQKIASLINVKTIVTFLLVGTYVTLTALQIPVSEYFTGLVGIVVAFYFGTQKQKIDNDNSGGK